MIEEKKDELNTGWKNPPKLSDLKEDYKNAKSYHDRVISKIKEWRTILLAPDRNFGKNRSKVTPKIVKRQAEWTYPIVTEPVLSSKNLFSSDPVTAEDPELAKHNTLILNHQFNKEINKVSFITDAVSRYVDDGTCIIKIGWDRKESYKYEYVPKYVWVPVLDPQLKYELQSAGLPPYQRVQKGFEKKLIKKIVKNAPYLEVLDPARVIIDPNAKGNIEKAQFIIEEFDTNLSNLKKQGIYKNLDKVEKHIEKLLSDEDDSDNYDNDENNENFNFKDKARKVITAIRYWGYWDIDGKGMTSPFVATWIGDILIHIERNPTPYLGLPFEVAQYKPVFHSNYGEPDAEIIKDNQEIIGAVTRGYVDMLGRSAASQRAIQKGYVDKLNEIKFENLEDYKFNAGFDPNTSVYMHDYPQVNQSALNMIQMQENMVESITGRKSFYGSGITGSAFGDSATSVRTAMDATAKREMGILRRFTNMLERIAYKIIAMNNVFLTDEQIQRITGSDYMIQHRDKDVGKYDIVIKIDTPEQKNLKLERLSFLMQTLGNTMPFEMTQLILEDMAELENMPDLAQKIRNYQPQPDPFEEQMKQLELQLLQARIQDLQVTAQENMADIELKRAKAQEAIMKAKALGSDANLKDLDYRKKYLGEDLEEKMREKMIVEKEKTQRELLKEKMKQDIVASQLQHNSIQKDMDRAKDIYIHKDKNKNNLIKKQDK
jgi:hypothetical protein